MQKLLFIAAILFFPGCITYEKFVKTIGNNPRISPANFSQKLKEKPIKAQSVNDNVSYEIYSLPWAAANGVVYFKDQKLECYGQESVFTHLDCLRTTGAIDESEYRWRYEMLQQQDIARRQEFLQIYSAAQNASYQQQSIQNQRTLVQSVNQPVYTSGTIYRLGDTYRYQGTSQPMILPSQ